MRSDGADDGLRKIDRNIPLSLVIAPPDRESILRALIERELDRLKHGRLAAWFDYLEKRAQLGSPSPDETESLAETKASRDLMVHNRGGVNQTHLSKAGAKDDQLNIVQPRPQNNESLSRDLTIDVPRP